MLNRRDFIRKTIIALLSLPFITLLSKKNVKFHTIDENLSVGFPEAEGTYSISTWVKPVNGDWKPIDLKFLSEKKKTYILQKLLKFKGHVDSITVWREV